MASLDGYGYYINMP